MSWNFLVGEVVNFERLKQVHMKGVSAEGDGSEVSLLDYNYSKEGRVQFPFRCRISRWAGSDNRPRYLIRNSRLTVSMTSRVLKTCTSGFESASEAIFFRLQ